MNLPTELRHVDIPTPDGIADSSLATPKDDGKYPGVIFLMDAFGVRPVIDEWVERIASKGYVVLAPNLLYRSQNSPIVEDVFNATSGENRGKLFQSLMPMMQLLTPDNLAKDGEAFVKYLAAQPKTKEGPMGLTGYCMGARAAIRIGASDPDRFAAIAGFHGGNLGTDKEDSPHLVAGSLKGEVYMGYADHDDGASPEQRERLDNALAQAGIPHLSEVYKDAPHGYTMRDTPAFREDAAEKHFDRLIDLLDRRLK